MPVLRLLVQFVSSIVGRATVDAYKQVSAKQKIEDKVVQNLVKQYKKRFMQWVRYGDPTRVYTDQKIFMWGNPPVKNAFQTEARRLHDKWKQHFDYQPTGTHFDTDAWMGLTETGGTTILSMPIPEAVKVLQLTEGTVEHVMERYKTLQAANNFKGASVYVRDKVEVAMMSAVKAAEEGKLASFIKVKEKPPTPSDHEANAEHSKDHEQQHQQGSEDNGEPTQEPPRGAEGEVPPPKQ